MSYQNNQNFQKNPEIDEGYASNSFKPIYNNVRKSIQVFFAQFLEWFQALPQWGKIIGLIILPIFVIKILEAVVSLVSLLITIGVFGGVIYLGYRFLIPPDYLGKNK